MLLWYPKHFWGSCVPTTFTSVAGDPLVWKKQTLNVLKMSLMDPGISVFCEECNFCIDPHEQHLNLEMWMHCLDLERSRDEIEKKNDIPDL